MPEFPLDPRVIARAIRIPLANWSGNCAAIAEALIKRFPVKGARLARGFWLGPVASRSLFAGRPYTQHSWILLADGRVLDPTRFAFEAVEPYIHVGPADYYDEAGDFLRRDRPKPARTRTAIMRKLPTADQHLLAKVLGRGHRRGFSDAELAWIANRPVREFAAPSAVYAALAHAGRSALIPYDNWMRIMEPERLRARKGQNGWYTLPAHTTMLEPADVAPILAPVFRHFLDAEHNVRVANWLEEKGWHPDDLMGAQRALESLAASGRPFALTDEQADVLAAVAFEHLGAGNARIVEQYVVERGISLGRFDAALRALGTQADLSLGWV